MKKLLITVLAIVAISQCIGPPSSPQNDTLVQPATGAFLNDKVAFFASFICDLGGLPILETAPIQSQSSELINKAIIMVKTFKIRNPVMSRVGSTFKIVKNDYNRLATDWNEVANLGCAIKNGNLNEVLSKEFAKKAGSVAFKSSYTVLKTSGYSAVQAFAKGVEETARDYGINEEILRKECGDACAQAWQTAESFRNLIGESADFILYDLSGFVGDAVGQATFESITLTEEKLKNEILPSVEQLVKNSNFT